MVRTLLNRFFGKILNESEPKNASKVNTAVNNTNRSNGSCAINLPAFVEFVVKSLVDCPDEVSIESTNDSNGKVIKISCRKNEIRKIIGKNGKTINSIRSLVRGAAKRENQNVSVVVVE